jgi:hypothetical protein
MRIDLVSIDARARDRFETVFRDQGHGAYVIVNSTVAEVAIIDLDYPDGNVRWQQYCLQFPNRPVILLSNTEPSLENGQRFLRKPIEVDALLEILEEIHQQLEPLAVNVNTGIKRDLNEDREPATIRLDKQSAAWCPSEFATVQTRPEAPADFQSTSEQTYRYPRPLLHIGYAADSSLQNPHPASATVPSDGNIGGQSDEWEPGDKTTRLSTCAEAQPQINFVSVQDRLLGLLQEALKESAASLKAVEIALENGRLLAHTPQGCIHSSFTDDQLKQLATSTFPATQVRITYGETDAFDPSLSLGITLPAWEPIEAVLWKLALWTYRGGLPLGTDLEKRVYLRHWPNLTRLHPVPDAMRIASLWNEQPMTFGYTATALGIPQQHVFSFYSASHTIGLAGQARREADYLFQETSTAAKSKRRFVSTMIKRLRFIGNS